MATNGVNHYFPLASCLTTQSAFLVAHMTALQAPLAKFVAGEIFGTAKTLKKGFTG